jgi:hypothetical protein
MVKISKLPANINKEMLLMFFEREIEDDGKVVDVTVNTNDSYAIVEFDKSVGKDLNYKPLKLTHNRFFFILAHISV